MINTLKNIYKKIEFHHEHRGIGPWGNIEKNKAEACYFGFFGEFGYGVISWLPYLEYLADQGIKINGVGPAGHKPLWSFANSFTSVNVGPGDSFGEGMQIRIAQRQLMNGKQIIAPTNLRRFGLSVDGHEWQNPWLHRSIDTTNYNRLFPRKKSVCHAKPYVILNHKNYFNWGNEHIVNFYKAQEIKFIADWARACGLDLLLNRFPAPVESTSMYNDDTDLISEIIAYPNVQDLALQYAKINDAAEQNELQFSFLSGAKHIFATQGGNAAIALVLGKYVSILMRGGMDYPDYTSLAKIYGANVDVAYEIEQLKVFKKLD